MKAHASTKPILLAAMLAVTAVAAPAEANIITATFTGTVSRGYDQTGVFGTPGTDLSGLPFKVVYTVDSNTPGAIPFTDPGVSGLYGGTPYGGAAPISAILTLGASTIDMGSGYFAQVFQTGGVYGLDQLDYEAFPIYSTDPSTNISTIRYVTDDLISDDTYFLPSTNFSAPLNYQLRPIDHDFGQFEDGLFDRTTGFYTVSDYAYFNTASVVVTNVGVPEPATWALLIMGFGVAGSMVRRRRFAT